MKRTDRNWAQMETADGLAQKMIEKDKHIVYSLVSSLVKWSLILFVAIVTVERVFSDMNLFKCSFRNQMEDEFINDYLVTYIERDIFKNVNIEKKNYVMLSKYEK